ncbi:MAG: outer membrane beta-barrel domain-containing protein [Deltaproteobacteria bacterium]|nr:outer membrane beta-barrel domain-containing protein [Deltaproteobacteria bacterium]
MSRARLIHAGLLTAAAVALLCGPARAAEVETGACVDETLKADLDAKRRRRFVKTRLYQKTNRHEITLKGGYYVSDVFDGSPVMGAAYTYHLTENFAVEAGGAYTKIASRSGIELERNFSVLEGKSRDSLLFATNLVVTPIYAKLQMGGEVARFDIQLTAGAGVVDSPVSSGVAGNAGIGFIFWTGRVMAVRFDFRDYVYRQQLLAERVWVNDLSATLGVSMFLPWRE